MEYPADLRYTKEHEWVRIEPDGTAAVGITDFAQSELGEIVFLELPDVGRAVEQGESLCVAESTKAASDIYAPIGGKVASVNAALSDAPNRVNQSPYSDGWLVKLTDIDKAQFESLMDSAEYGKFVKH